MSDEKTLSLIKPDAVERNLIGKIIDIFETNEIVIEKIKKVHVSNEFAKKFYDVHKDKPFFKELCNYLSSGPIIAMVLKGENVIKKNRDLMGATNPKDAKEGTIRQKFAISIDKNSVHGSDSEENASKEISLFFS
ncbi:MAG: nucleoside-diphosphate kinase [Candidatus Pelagibacter sp.]|nr:nucleoside-diphosphate kinase [Candidatus Pelagibacter sp.]|tara:strand:- start:8338 stop:8742 length:405 start_codon:yes stop_codon:yes gene_type:complete